MSHIHVSSSTSTVPLSGWQIRRIQKRCPVRKLLTPAGNQICAERKKLEIKEVSIGQTHLTPRQRQFATVVPTQLLPSHQTKHWTSFKINKATDVTDQTGQGFHIASRSLQRPVPSPGLGLPCPMRLPQSAPDKENFPAAVIWQYRLGDGAAF